MLRRFLVLLCLFGLTSVNFSFAYIPAGTAMQAGNTTTVDQGVNGGDTGGETEDEDDGDVFDDISSILYDGTGLSLPLRGPNSLSAARSAGITGISNLIDNFIEQTGLGDFIFGEFACSNLTAAQIDQALFKFKMLRLAIRFDTIKKTIEKKFKIKDKKQLIKKMEKYIQHLENLLANPNSKYPPAKVKAEIKKFKSKVFELKTAMARLTMLIDKLDTMIPAIELAIDLLKKCKIGLSGTQDPFS